MHFSNRHKRILLATTLAPEMSWVIVDYVPYPQTKGQRKRIARGSHRKLLRELSLCDGVFQIHSWILNLILQSPDVCVNIREMEKGCSGECHTWDLCVGSRDEERTRMFGYEDGAMSDVLLRTGLDDNDVQYSPRTRRNFSKLLRRIFGRLSFVRYHNNRLEPV